jgi:phosphate transport system substrate-binding protein
VELAYAKQNNLPYANVRNAAGRYVTPSIASVTADAAAMKLPKNTDYRISIVNAPGANSYPISSMTWILVYQNQVDAAKGAKLVNFLRWAYRNGEKSASSLDYAPLPAPMLAALENRLKTIQIAGSQVGAAR